MINAFHTILDNNNIVMYVERLLRSTVTVHFVSVMTVFTLFEAPFYSPGSVYFPILKACVFNTWGPLAQSAKTGFGWSDAAVAWIPNIQIISGMVR